MNIFEPGDTILVGYAPQSMIDLVVEGRARQIIAEFESAAAECRVSVFILPGGPERIEVLGVYRPSKTCVCE